ncbi:MAG: hypothetical protein ABI361_12880 [Nitrososphaera sp.]
MAGISPVIAASIIIPAIAIIFFSLSPSQPTFSSTSQSAPSSLPPSPDAVGANYHDPNTATISRHADDSSNWTVSDPQSVFVQHGSIYIGSNGRFNDYAWKQLSIPLSNSSGIVLEQRMKLESGGKNYRLPLEIISFENGTQLIVTDLPDLQHHGWNFGGWTGIMDNSVPGTGDWNNATANYWAVTRIVLSDSQATLYVKPDDAARGWYSNHFVQIATLEIKHSVLTGIKFQQPWDSINYIDYLRIYRSPLNDTSTQAPPLQDVISNIESLRSLGIAQETSFFRGDGLAADGQVQPNLRLDTVVQAGGQGNEVLSAGPSQSIRFTYYVDVRNDLTPDAFHCSDTRVQILVDGKEVALSHWLGYEGRNPALPLDTGIVTIGNVTSGTHLLTLIPEGRLVGCDTDYLRSWGGTLVIFN